MIRTRKNPAALAAMLTLPLALVFAVPLSASAEDGDSVDTEIATEPYACDRSTGDACVVSPRPGDASLQRPYFHRIEVVKQGTRGRISFGMGEGSLPPGLSLDPFAGTITGTPTAAGSFAFQLYTYDETGSGSLWYTLDVIDHSVSLQCSPGIFGTVGLALNERCTASAPDRGTWRVVAGALPPGVTLDADTGRLTGVPGSRGEYTATLEYRTAYASASTPVTFQIRPPRIWY
ncbi:Ig domain-containing protein [Cnuibacter sp. UC19_7]|uniref:Ig domain-containing protein n=1 Tax=Cnuibacter sp. UC19_7 TaxID=3350166 RepID=UPI003670507E